MSRKIRTGPASSRDLVTLQTLAYSSTSHLNGRSQLVSRFVRLENERARLERELGMWTARGKATEDKLSKVYDQLDALRPLLQEEPAKMPVARQARRRAGPRASTEVSGAVSPRSRSFALDY